MGRMEGSENPSTKVCVKRTIEKKKHLVLVCFTALANSKLPKLLSIAGCVLFAIFRLQRWELNEKAKICF